MKQQAFAKSLSSVGVLVLMIIMPIVSSGIVSATPSGRSASLLEDCAPATGVVIQPPYTSGYVACALGNFTGLPNGIGAITFKRDDPNTLLVATNVTSYPGMIYSVPVQRNADNHIIGVNNPGTLFATASYVDSGMAYGPGNILFYSRWPVNEIGEIKPGSVSTDKVIALSSLGFPSAVSGLNFVPDGFPYAGELKLVAYQTGDWYAAELSPEADGTYSIATITKKAKISNYNEAFTYVPTSSPQFPDYSAMLVAEYYNGVISAYTLDSESNPVPNSRSTFLSGIFYIKGSVIDPLTGDLIFTTRGARVTAVRGFGTQPWVPTPTPTVTTSPAPTYEIRGRVTLGINGPGLDGVDINLDGVLLGRTSNGYIYIPNLAAGTYKVTVRRYDLSIQPSECIVTVPPEATCNFIAEYLPQPPPVILVHGWLGQPGDKSDKCSLNVSHYDTSNKWFDDLPKWLSLDGFDVWIAHWDSGPDWTAPLEVNGECLAKEIQYVKEQTGFKKVILVAHSMGGPVSRAYLQSSTYASRQDVETLITFGSPHGGIVGIGVIAQMPFIGLALSAYCIIQPAFCQIDPSYMRLFNSRNEKNSVDYYFTSGDGGGGPLAGVLYPLNGPNDGLVSTASAGGKYFGWFGNTNAVNHPVTRFLTGEDHLRQWGTWYFAPSPGQTWSDSYKCLREILLQKERADCTAAPAAQVSAQEQEPPFAFAPQQSGHISTGETISRTLSIDSTGRSIFTLSWNTQILSLALVDPNGVTIDPDYAMSNPSIVTFDSGPADNGTPGWMTYTFTNTVPGTWTLSISAPDAGPDGSDWAAIAGFESNRTLEAGTGAGFYKIGDTATLTATLTNGTVGITGANVSVELSRPDNITDTLTLTDMGGGLYQGTYTIPDAAGYVGVTFNAHGDDGGTAYSRQSSQLLSIMPQTGQLTGNYADRAVDEDADRWADALDLDVGINISKAGDYNLTADIQAGDQVVAQFSKVFTATAGSQTMTLRFNGNDIYNAGLDGPYLLTNLVLVDLKTAVPTIMQSDLYTTEAYTYSQFMPVSTLYLPIIIR